MSNFTNTDRTAVNFPQAVWYADGDTGTARQGRVTGVNITWPRGYQLEDVATGRRTFRVDIFETAAAAVAVLDAMDAELDL